MPWEAASYLLAAAAIDPAWALSVADGLLLTHKPEDLVEAMCLMGRVARWVGLGDALFDRAQRQDFVTVQAAWTQAAAAANVINGKTLEDIVDMLAERAIDELDPGDDPVIHLHLLMSLAYSGMIDKLIAMSKEWGFPPPLLVHQIFYNQISTAAAKLYSHSELGDAIRAPKLEWSGYFAHSFGWWMDACTDADLRLQTSRDVLSLAVEPPWRPLPGSLADIVHWPPQPGRAGSLHNET